MDFGRGLIVVHAGKGAKDRVTMLPDKLKLELQQHLAEVRALHERDLVAGFGGAALPAGLARKYPNVSREWLWQWVFPSRGVSEDPRARQISTPPHEPTQRFGKDKDKSSSLSSPNLWAFLSCGSGGSRREKVFGEFSPQPAP